MKNSSSGDQLLPTHNPPPPVKEDDDSKQGKALLSPEYASSPLIAGTAYCCVSAAMVLLNKFALSGFDFTCPNTLLLLQCITAVVFVKVAEMLGFWKLERLRWDVVQVQIQPLSQNTPCMISNKAPHNLNIATLYLFRMLHCTIACRILHEVSV